MSSDEPSRGPGVNEPFSGRPQGEPGAASDRPRPRLVAATPMATEPPPAEETPKSKTATAAPPQKRARRRDSAFVGYLSGLFTFLTLLVFLAGGALYWAKARFDGRGPLEKDATVMIQRNQGLSEISEALTRGGVIDQPKLFEFGVRFYGQNDKLRYGEFAFPAGVSMREAMEIIASGKSIEYTVTIPEGLTSLQIVDRLRDQPLLTGDIKDTPPEGSLLPETYNFTRGAARQQIVQRMQQLHKEVVQKAWDSRRPTPGVKTPEDLVTLASLVEKETGIAEERPRVAAVFANRLARGMRLQSDPTIVYGLVGGRGTLGRSLNRTDIQSRTPYNTYVVPGLPAGPIANPGRDAIEAAAQPAETKDLYFVADGTGGHAFAPSLVEHNRNVAKWRQIERTAGAPADRLAPDAAAAEADQEEPTSAPPSSAPPPAPKKGAKPR
ncbi:endolytic transglycosylase MltG [Hansschlegelia quercus]|nr:endolytic transglycosylase MltG [Hansschlegelia quercus]